MAETITLTDESKAVLVNEIAKYQQIENELNREIIALEGEVIQLTAKEAVETNKKTKSEIKNNIKVKKNEINLKRLNFTTNKTNREAAETKLAQLNAQATKVYVTQNTTDSVLKTFTDNNIHYVINGRKWWRVEQDVTGNIHIKDHDYHELKDLVFYSTDWEIKEEMETGTLLWFVVGGIVLSLPFEDLTLLVDLKEFWVGDGK